MIIYVTEKILKNVHQKFINRFGTPHICEAGTCDILIMNNDLNNLFSK